MYTENLCEICKRNEVLHVHRQMDKNKNHKLTKIEMLLEKKIERIKVRRSEKKRSICIRKKSVCVFVHILQCK